MAAKFGFEAIKYVLTKVLTKKGSKGIARIPGKAYDMRMKQLVDEMAFKMKALGYDINNVTQKEVQGLLDSAEALAKQKKPTVEGLAKGEKYTDERGRTWDFGTKDRPFPGANLKAVPKVTIDEHITFIKSKEPIESMKEANKVIKREGRYKNLTNDESQKILKDTDDHIFERDIKPDEFDPDYASGGIARMGFAGGLLAKGAKWFINSISKNLTDLRAGHPRFKVVPVEEQKMLIQGYQRMIKELEAGSEVPKEALEAISKNPQYYKTKKATRSQDPDLAEVEELIDEKVFGHVRQELKDFETVGRKSNATGGRVPLMYGGDPGFAFEYGGSWADWHDQHRDQMPVEQYIKTKLPKDRLPFREMQTGGLAYMLGEPTYMKYGAGGSVGHAPWLKPSGQPQPQGQTETPTPNIATRPDPMKAPRGLPSLAPKNMDPAYMQQQMMQRAMMGQRAGNTGQGPRPMAKEGGRIGFAEGPSKKGPSKEDFTKQLLRKRFHDLMRQWEDYQKNYEWEQARGEPQEAAEGGIMRAAFKEGGNMTRRGFLKLMAGIAAIPVVGKYFKAAKLAKPAAAVTETIVKSNAAGMPAWFPSLVKRVLKEGDDISKGAATAERQTVHSIKLPESGTPVQVTRDLVTDDIIVDIGEQTKHGWSAGRHGQPVQLQLKKGEWIEPTKGKKGVKTKDEFIVDEAEFTGGHPENVKFEESVQFKYGDHGSDFSEIEKYAVGKNIDKKIVGKKAKSDAWAEGRAESAADEVEFAQGGLAYLLGE